jgi:molecular chaperone DnaK
MTKLIEKNTTIPTKASQVFSTADDNQNAVTVHVLQGERDRAMDNKSLGRFDLSDIPSAPRGMPQIEVAFDIDANGILNVSAKDKATNKAQSIVIRASSGLSDEEVQRMVKDAEVHKEDDKKFKELVDVRNQADGLIHSTEKSLKEAGDTVSADEKSRIEAAITALKDAMKGDDKAAMEAKVKDLTEVSHKLAEKMYAKQGAAGAGGADAGSQSQSQDHADTSKKEDVVDAEFEEVNDDKKS